MFSQCATVDLRATALLAYAVVDIEDDARESIFIDIDFLVVGNLPDLAVASTCSAIRSSSRRVIKNKRLGEDSLYKGFIPDIGEVDWQIANEGPAV